MEMPDIDDEDLDLEIYDFWVKEKEDDHFRDTYEWLLAWDYFKAGYIAALNNQKNK
jgi:hypothetical protein